MRPPHLPQHLQRVPGGNIPEHPDRQARPREGVPLQEAVRDVQQFAHPAHLVLEQPLEGLHQLELEVLGEAPHVVVALDRVAVLLVAAGGGARLDDVRVEGALDEDLGQLAVLLLDLGEKGSRRG